MQFSLNKAISQVSFSESETPGTRYESQDSMATKIWIFSTLLQNVRFPKA